MTKKVSAFAPGSIANFFVGFDILGLSFDKVGDTVTLEENESNLNTNKIEIKISIFNHFNKSPLSISTDYKKNTGGMALFAIMNDFKIKKSVHLTIEKGIPLSSGLGGSAASAIGAVVVANEFFKLNLSQNKLIEYALIGEHVASKSFHADNLVPSLIGGLNLIISTSPVNFITLPTPKIWISVIHPHLELETSYARSVLSENIPQKLWVHQSQYLSAFISACYTSDIDLLSKILQDLIIEPQRKHLIPGFDILKQNALKQGAIGFTISGAGPTLLAVSKNLEMAELISKSSALILEKNFNLKSDIFTSDLNSKGAKLL